MLCGVVFVYHNLSVNRRQAQSLAVFWRLYSECGYLPTLRYQQGLNARERVLELVKFTLDFCRAGAYNVGIISLEKEQTMNTRAKLEVTDKVVEHLIKTQSLIQEIQDEFNPEEFEELADLVIELYSATESATKFCQEF